jgi:hypothetical protein
MDGSSENLPEVEEKGRESSCCSSETTRQEEEEQSPSCTEDFTASPVSSRWSVKNIDGEKKKIRSDSRVSGSSIFIQMHTKCLLLFLTDNLLKFVALDFSV